MVHISMPSAESRQNFGDEGDRLADMTATVERRLVSATWTLRRLPDRERSFMRMRTMMWPEGAQTPGTYAPAGMSYMQARRRIRIEPQEIDAMQPALDMLPLLPDVADRQILFWAAWHQDGEVSAKIPWAKVRRSLGADLSRWTLKRRNDNGLKWLAQIVLAQA
ncbi:hypothetical protein [Kordiimonas aquimaris]|uniref:hypothetical protein n=1 Tax=Kordiimonas aquimaris TaxID=707591 RepID=UPI0021D3E39A|nr:hypothetical protein [Kordiimonas aquimaris]